MVEFGQPYETFRPKIKTSDDVRNSIIGCGIVLLVFGAIAGFVLYFVLSSFGGGVDEVIRAMEMNLPADANSFRVRERLDKLGELSEKDELTSDEIKMLTENYEHFNSDGVFTASEVRQMDKSISLVLLSHGITQEPSPGRRVVIPPRRNIRPPSAPRYSPPPRRTTRPPSRTTRPPSTSRPSRTTTPRRT